MKRTLWFCLFIGLAAFSLQSVCVAQDAETLKGQFGLPAQYAATAFGQAGSTAGKSFGLNLYITGLTDDTQAQQLVATLQEKGQDALVNTFAKMKEIGRISPTGSVGTGVPFVRIRATKDGGQRIIMATDRPISFPELYRSGRSTDYKIAIVVLNLDKDGKGSGTFAPLCKVKFNKKKELEIENYGQKPFRLTNVYRQK